MRPGCVEITDVQKGCMVSLFKGTLMRNVSWQACVFSRVRRILDIEVNGMIIMT
jgi:hypothetical protein